MPISFDPMQREWLDLGPTNPGLVDELRPLLVFFIAWDSGSNPTILGSGTIIAAGSYPPGAAVVLTARHVMAEFAVDAQKPHLVGTAGLFREVRPADHLSLDPKRLKVAWMGRSTAAFLNVLSTSFNDFSDMQGCFIAAQIGEEPNFVGSGSVPLDLRPVVVGETVYQLSCGALGLTEIQEPAGDWAGQILRISRHVSIRVGTVTGIFSDGRRGRSWPAFTTSIPSSPGMSGGAVLRIEDNRPSICGVISSDFSPNGAGMDFNVRGDTVAMMVWPTLALKLTTAENLSLTWFEAMQTGVMSEPIGGLSSFSINENSSGEITMKVPQHWLPVVL
jgi:hypothetical protein